MEGCSSEAKLFARFDNEIMRERGKVKKKCAKVTNM